MLSVVIPSRNEQFLSHTVNDILNAAKGELEIIVVLDGYWPVPPLKDDKRLHFIHRGASRGMRSAINSGVAMAKGEYIMKTDAHCMFDVGFDLKVVKHCEEQTVVVPRRKRLDAENWCIQETGKPDIDYMYLAYADTEDDFGGPGLNGKVWNEKNKDESLKNILVDDLMSAQGSAWCMRRDYFYFLELMDEKNYGSFWNEFQEIGLKSWLSGGRVIVDKNTWYAHLHKGKKYGRGYNLSNRALQQGATYTRGWLEKKMWEKQTLPLSWLVEKFWPVPSWPENYKEICY